MMNFLQMAEMIFLYPLVIYVDLKIGGVTCGNGFMNSHTISKQYQDVNNDDVSFGNIFINSHTISQYNRSSYFTNMDGDIEMAM